MLLLPGVWILSRLYQNIRLVIFIRLGTLFYFGFGDIFSDLEK